MSEHERMLSKIEREVIQEMDSNMIYDDLDMDDLLNDDELEDYLDQCDSMMDENLDCLGHYLDWE